MIENNHNWKRALIREEFAKLYFDYLGLSENFSVNKLTDLYEINSSKKKEKFLFAIIATKKNNSLPSNEIVEDTNINEEVPIFYDPTISDTSEKFLSLAYSGLANIFEDNKKMGESNDLFKKYKNADEMKKNILHEYFKKFFDQFKESNNDTKTNHVNLKNYFLNKHNKIIKKLFGDRMDRIPIDKREQSNSDPPSFSLFILKGNNLLEYNTKESEDHPSIVCRNVEKNSVNDCLLDYIIECNKSEKQRFIYQSDATIFTENEDSSEQDVSSSSDSFLTILILSVIFILNFIIAVPNNVFYDLRNYYINLLELDDNGNNYLDNIKNIDEIKNYFENMLDILFDPLKNTYNYTLTTTQGLSLDMPNEKKTFQFQNTFDKYYISNANMFCGLSINFKHAKFEDRENINHKKFSNRISKYNYYSTEPINKQEIFGSYDTTTYSSILYPDSYYLFIRSTANRNQLTWYKQQTNLIFAKDLYEFDLTFIFYNTDVYIASVYSVNISIDSFGRAVIKRYYHGFQPFLAILGGKFFLMLIINIVYFILLTTIIFGVVRTWSHAFIEYIKTRNYILEWYDWVDMLVLVVTFISNILFFTLLLFRNREFPIIMQFTAEFEYWVSLSLQINSWQKITGIGMILTMIRLVRSLSIQFPTFGIVFESVQKAYNELLAATIIVILILIGIMSMFHVNFGWYSEAYKDLQISFLSVFLMFMGIFDYNDMINENNYMPLTPIFFIVFMIIFNLILINIFLCIIRNNYWEIKGKRELFNQAYSLMLSDGTLELKSKLVNLFTCQHPLQVEHEIKMKNMNKDDELDLEEEDNLDNERNINNSQIEQQEGDVNLNARIRTKPVNLWERFKYHFESLNLKKLLSGGWDRENFNKKKLEKFKVIWSSNLNHYLSELEVNYEKEFYQLLDTLCYISFIIIFVMMFLIQMKVGLDSKIDEYVNLKILSQFGNDDIPIRTFLDVGNRIDNFLDTLYADKNENSTFNFIAKNYIFIEQPFLRVTVRKLKFNPNSVPQEAIFFPYELTDSSPFTFTTCPSASEYNMDFTDSDFRLSYESPYQTIRKTPFNCGGFVYLFNYESPFKEEYNDTKYDYNWPIFKKNMLSSNVGSLILDMAIFNKHYDFALYIRINFIRQIDGRIKFTTDNNFVPINRYETRENFSRAVLELLYITFVFYYILLQFKEINANLHKELRNEFGYNTKERMKEKTDLGELVSRYFNFDDLKKFENEGLINALIGIIFKLIEKVIKFAYFYSVSVISYLSEDAFNILNFISVIISCYLIILWISIIIVTSGMNFEYKDYSNYKNLLKYNGENLYIFDYLVELYNLYIFWSGVNACIILLRTLQFYRFSKSINSLLIFIKKASQTLIFHIIFILIVDIGFALMAYSIFSQSIEYFASFEKCLLTQIIILSGNLETKRIIQADPLWGTLYIILFTIINFLVLLNILFSIIIEAYNDVKHDQKQNSSTEKTNFFANVIKVIQEQIKLTLATTQLYYINLYFLMNKEVLKKFDTYNSAVNQNEEDIKAGKALESEKQKTRNDLLRKFINDVNLSKNECDKSTIYGKFIDDYRNRFNEISKDDGNILNNNDLINKSQKNDKLMEDVKIDINPMINFNSEVSLLTKMLAYISYKLELSYDNLIFYDLNSQDDNINNKSTLSNSSRIKPPENKQIDEIDVHGKNEWYTYLSKNFESDFLTNKSRYFKPGLFYNCIDKYNYSKALDLSTKNVEYCQIYSNVENSYENIFNINPLRETGIHMIDLKQDLICMKDIDMMLRSYSIKVYDLLIKNFYVPKDNTDEEKELYISYYMYYHKYQMKNETLKNLNTTIPEYRLKLFIEDIQNMKNNYDEVNNRIKESGITDNDDYKCLFDIAKNYYIWNTLYIILFKKNNNYVRELRNESDSFKYFEKKSQDSFINMFHKNFKLNQEIGGLQLNTNYPPNTKLYELLKFIYKKNFLDNNTIDESSTNLKIQFYKDVNKYLINEDKENLYSLNYPKDLEDIKFLSKNGYPKIFKYLWYDDYNEEDRFSLFFGFSLSIHQNYINSIDDLFIKDIDMDSKVIKFFVNSHHGEILNFISFPAFLNKAFYKNLNMHIEKGSISISEQRLSLIKNVDDIITYFHEIKMNYSKQFNFITEVIEKEFSVIKNTISQIKKDHINKYQMLCKLKPSETGSTTKEKQAKVDFKEFYELLSTKLKVKKVKEIILNNQNKKTIKTINKLEEIKIIDIVNLKIQAEEEDDLFHRAQYDKNTDKEKNIDREEIRILSLVYILCMPNYMLLDAIRKVGSFVRKQLYTTIYVYLYGNDDFESNSIEKRLKRKIKYNMIQKYLKCSEYLMMRDNNRRIQNEYEEQKKYYEIACQFLENAYNKYENLISTKDRLIINANNKISSDNEDNVD